MSDELWPIGDHILLRDVVGGHVRSAIPVTVVEHTEEQLVLFVCPGTTFMLPEDWNQKDSRDFYAVPGHVALEYSPPGQLIITAPEARHSILVRWTPDWDFVGWYVNLQAPMQRTALGVDITDQLLDVVIAPDCSSFEWKDVEEFERAIAEGFFSGDEAAEIRAEGERAVAAAMEGQPPFSEPWPQWRPDPVWGVPVLPDGWATVS